MPDVVIVWPVNYTKMILFLNVAALSTIFTGPCDRRDTIHVIAVSRTGYL